MDLKKKIEEFIITEVCSDLNLDIQSIKEDQRLLDSGILDSLSILKLLSFLDEELNVNISSSNVKPENFKTLNTICNMVISMGMKESE